MTKATPESEERDKLIYKLHKEGLTYRKIGARVGVSSTRVFNVVCRIESALIDRRNQPPHESMSYWSSARI